MQNERTRVKLKKWFVYTIDNLKLQNIHNSNHFAVTRPLYSSPKEIHSLIR